MRYKSKVRFKHDYDGYFRDYKSQVLTIKSIIKDNGETRIQLNEIKEIHLINPIWVTILC